jgi:hypothetical protein
MSIAPYEHRAGHYTVTREGERVWVGSAASELAYHSARAEILGNDNLRLQQYIERLELRIVAASKCLTLETVLAKLRGA